MSRFKGSKHRKPNEREEHLALIADLYLKKTPLNVIAKQIGISNATITRDVKLLVARWRKSALSSIDDKIQIELESINKTEAEAWEAWERSKLNKEKRVDKVNAVHAKMSKAISSREGVVPGTEKLIETIKSSEGQYGDPRFLEVIAKCIERRCKLMGLDKPEKLQIEGKPTFEVILTDETAAKPE